MTSGGQHRFGEFLLDAEGRTLRRGQQEAELAPKAFQVLLYLIEHRERLVPKEELFHAVWKDTFVTDDALVQCITAIRRALADDADQPRFVRTKARVGYQFIAAFESAPAVAPLPAGLAPVGRGTARALFLVIQAGYLTLYGLTLSYLDAPTEALNRRLSGIFEGGGASLVFLVSLTLAGIAVRLYLATTVGLDHPLGAANFGRIFPLVLALDLVWALSPLALAERTGIWLALALVPVMAYGPFAQRILVRTAYAPDGGAQGGD